jgi:capsular polysaccharide biosynthesis protein
VKQSLKKILIRSINHLGISSEKIGTPKDVVRTAQWCASNNAEFVQLHQTKSVSQNPPVTINGRVHVLFRREYDRIQEETFAAIIYEGRVWGRNGAIITPDDLLLGDVSREFGAYGGILGKEHSVFKQVKLHAPCYINGTVAVIASPGASNFHHWMYDNIPRLHLIEKAGLLKDVDYFVLDHVKTPYQIETLKLLGIPDEKVLNCNDNWRFHIKAKKLIVPSLPSRLGVVSDWCVDYLRGLVLKEQKKSSGSKRIYISRRKAASRRITNEADLISVLAEKGFTEYFAEDHSVSETAALFNEAEYVVGAHGSGLSNLAFASRGVKVIDIVAPLHLDPYYWVLTGLREGKYAYLPGEGIFDEETIELVKQKVDHDITVNINSLKKLLSNLES